MTSEEFSRTSPLHVEAENTAPASYFDGTSYLSALSAEQVPVGCVTFAPGCRNHWHIHRVARGGGQILLVTARWGWYQERGETPRALCPGNVVNISPNVKHWHEAAVDSASQHLTVEVLGEGPQNEWYESVDTVPYRAPEALTDGTNNQQEVFYGTKDNGGPRRAGGLYPQIRPAQ